MKRLFPLLFSVLMVLAVDTGCAAFQKVLPIVTDVINLVQDAQTILATIDAAAQVYFKENPNKELEVKYAKAMGKCQSALTVASRAAKGTKELSEEQADAAFNDFKTAYQELAGLLQGAGIMAKDGALKAGPGEQPVRVQEPLALSRGKK